MNSTFQKLNFTAALSATRQFCSKKSVKSTDEKASEIGQIIFPYLKKYGIIIIPGFTVTVLTTFVVNNPDIRYKVEDYFPSYVNLVRKYYGFGDENIVERNRIKLLLEQQTKDISATIYFQNGHYLNVILSGSSSYSEIITKYQQEQHSLIIDILFNDENISNNSISNQNTQSNILIDSNSLSGDDDDEKISHNLLYNTFIHHSGNNLSYITKSSWDSSTIIPPSIQSLFPLPQIKESTSLTWLFSWLSFLNISKKSTNKTLEEQVTYPLDESIIRHEMIHRLCQEGRGLGVQIYEYALYYKLYYIHQYLQSGHFQRLHIPKPLILEDITPNATSSYTSSSSSSRSIEKAQAQQEILKLNIYINSLQYERERGSHRDMDLIEQDIQKSKKRIIELQRKYINWFYYF